MYTTELYKSLTVIDNATVIGNAAQHENSEVRAVGEVESNWSQKWISLENSL